MNSAQQKGAGLANFNLSILGLTIKRALNGVELIYPWDCFIEITCYGFSVQGHH